VATGKNAYGDMGRVDMCNEAGMEIHEVDTQQAAGRNAGAIGEIGAGSGSGSGSSRRHEGETEAKPKRNEGSAATAETGHIYRENRENRENRRGTWDIGAMRQQGHESS
jgi:hypothetical protein